MRVDRLRRTADIEIVRERGHQRIDRHFTLRSRANGRGVVRLAVTAPRSVGGSVRRNRTRRRVREAIRTQLRGRDAAPGTDLFVVARPAALDAPADALRAAVRRHIDDALGPADR